MGEHHHLSGTATKARGLFASVVASAVAPAIVLAIALVLAMIVSAEGDPAPAYATTSTGASLATASSSEPARPETEGLAAPYLKMDLGQLSLSIPDGVTVKKADGSGVIVSGTVSQLDGASVTLDDTLNFNDDKSVGRVSLDGLAPAGASVAVDVCFDGQADPVAHFALRNQEKAGNWQAAGDLTHDALGSVPTGECKVSLRLSVTDAAADQNVSILLRSIEFAQSSLPTVYLDLDATTDDISDENKEKGYGTLAEMLASRDHDVRCAGTATFVVPEGFKVENGYGEESYGEDSFTADLEYVRGRGNSTWDEKRPKKPFKFKFAKKRELFGMSANKHWVLLANSFDGSLVRDRLTSWIGNKIGLEYTYKCVPVDLVVNEVFYGSYLLCEQVRVDANRINIGTPDFDDKTGGYLLSRGQPKVGDPDAITTRQNMRMLVKSPSHEDAVAAEDEEQLAEAAKYHDYISDYVQRVENALFGVGYKNADGESYANLVDVDSAVKYWWVQEFSKNTDAFVTGSSYYYKKSDLGGGKLYWGPLWDFDLAWGNDPFRNRDFDKSAAYVLNDRKDPWLDQLKGDPAFTAKLKQFWKGTLKGALAEAAKEDGVLDRYYDETLVSWCYDREKWGDALYADENAAESGENVDMSLKGEIGWLKWWINRMSALTDGVIDELGNSRCTVTFVVDGKQTGQMSVEANETMARVPDAPAKAGYVFVGWYLPSGAQAKPGSTAFTGNTTLTARYLEAGKAVSATGVYFKNAHVYWPDNGDPFKPSYTVVPTSAQERSITWTSSNTAVAMVDASGAVSPYGIGVATITAKLKSGATFSYKFEVLDRTDIGPASSPSIRVEPSVLTLVEGDVAQIRAATNAHDTANEMFSFEPKDARIASIDENGVVTGLKPGKTTVTVEDLDSGVKATCSITVKPRGWNLSGSKLVLSKTKYVYNRKVQRPTVKTVGGRVLKAGVDYSISWSAPKSKNVGTYRVKVVGKGLYSGTSAAATYKIVKAANPLKVKGKTVKFKVRKLKAKSRSVARSKAFKVQKKRSSGKLVFKKLSGNAKIKVSKAGKVTAKKGLRKGTYRVKVKVVQRASKNYKAKTIKRVTVKVKVA